MSTINSLNLTEVLVFNYDVMINLLENIMDFNTRDNPYTDYDDYVRRSSGDIPDISYQRSQIKKIVWNDSIGESHTAWVVIPIVYEEVVKKKISVIDQINKEQLDNFIITSKGLFDIETVINNFTMNPKLYTKKNPYMGFCDQVKANFKSKSIDGISSHGFYPRKIIYLNNNTKEKLIFWIAIPRFIYIDTNKTFSISPVGLQKNANYYYESIEIAINETIKNTTYHVSKKLGEYTWIPIDSYYGRLNCVYYWKKQLEDVESSFAKSHEHCRKQIKQIKPIY